MINAAAAASVVSVDTCNGSVIEVSLMIVSVL